MLNLRLADIAQWTCGHLHGAADRVVTHVSTDTRSLESGALFIALKGERYDAHEYVAIAAEKGAVAALVTHLLPIDLPQIVVADTLHALGALAKAVRHQHHLSLIGITGSNGKTTVKTLVAAILQRHGKTHLNAGNLNNEVGLPLTLLAMPADAKYAVLEMGAGKPGDIAYLAAIAQPCVGLVNNVAPAHLQRMHSLTGIAETKGMLYSALPQNGIAIINADDAFASYFATLAGKRRMVRFGLANPADVSARVKTRGQFTLMTPQGDIDIALPLPGQHNVMNALAASAIAFALNIPLDTIRHGLEASAPIRGRLICHQHSSGAVLIDDSYNANPGSFAAAIATLAAESGETWLVMGDMAELGAQAEHLHAETGALAKRAGISQLYAVGPLSRAAVTSFGNGAIHYTEQAALITALTHALKPHVTVLIKGSRSSAMERVVHTLLEGENLTTGRDRHAA